MKTLTAFLLTVGLVLVPSQTVAGERTKVAFVGDSITWGAYLDHPETQRFPTVAANLLGKRTRVSVYATPGIRLDQTDFGPVFGTHPDVVVVNLGTNDFNQSRPVEGVQSHLLALKRLAKKTRTTLYVMTLPPIYGDAGYSGVVNTWIKATFGKRTIDAASVMGTENMFWDNIHPNVSGHEAMGRLVARRLR